MLFHGDTATIYRLPFTTNLFVFDIVKLVKSTNLTRRYRELWDVQRFCDVQSFFLNDGAADRDVSLFHLEDLLQQNPFKISVFGSFYFFTRRRSRNCIFFNLSTIFYDRLHGGRCPSRWFCEALKRFRWTTFIVLVKSETIIPNFV